MSGYELTMRWTKGEGPQIVGTCSCGWTTTRLRTTRLADDWDRHITETGVEAHMAAGTEPVYPGGGLAFTELGPTASGCHRHTDEPDPANCYRCYQRRENRQRGYPTEHATYTDNNGTQQTHQFVEEGGVQPTTAIAPWQQRAVEEALTAEPGTHVVLNVPPTPNPNHQRAEPWPVTGVADFLARDRQQRAGEAP